jgi:chorismate mutase/prephenate dehydratase
MRVGFLGPKASYSHEAAQKIFPSFEKKAFDSISLAISAVEKNEVDYSVIPIENSTGGSITVTLDELVEKNVFISSEFLLPINHVFLSNSKKNKIDKIYSHAQGFAQCRNWIENKYPKAELIEVQSTSKAAQLSFEEENSAAIASEFAAKEFSLTILEKNISDSKSNETRFVVISNKENSPQGKNKTSIVFGVKDKPGALFDAIESFKRFGVNMTKIESRPSRKKNWEYLFFVDLDGNTTQKNILSALKELQEHCKDFKNLGSYSRVKT